MDIEAIVKSLDGAPLRRITDTWIGFFEGSIRIEELQTDDASIRFDILIPTSPSDIGDFIWERERSSGTTNKIVLTQGDRPVPGAKVIGIAREGAAANWTASPAEQYRIRFEVPAGSVQSGVPLGVRLRWPAEPTAEDVATATGRLR